MSSFCTGGGRAKLADGSMGGAASRELSMESGAYSHGFA
jgi:hypothetical protein